MNAKITIFYLNSPIIQITTRESVEKMTRNTPTPPPQVWVIFTGSLIKSILLNAKSTPSYFQINPSENYKLVAIHYDKLTMHIDSL